MPIRKPADLLDDLPRGARVLGLDVGRKTIGLAISDVGRSIASPRETVRRTRLKADLARLREVIEREEVGALVIGLPVNMDGTEGPRCQSVRQFAADLGREIDLPVAFWDERLSTRAGERLLIEADMSRRRRKQVIDKVAAAVILQGFLDFAGARKPA